MLFAVSEEDLQGFINVSYKWWTKRGMSVNKDIIKIVHSRNPSMHESTHDFVLGEQRLHIIHKYKYLGII